MTSTVRLPPPKPCRSIGSCSSADGGKPHQTIFATGTITDLTTDDTLLVFRAAGYQMLNRPHIALRIEQLRQAAIKKSHATVGTILKEIDEARELAMEIEQPAAAATASMSKARLAGFLKPEAKLHLGGVSVNVMLTAADVSVC